MLKDDRFLEEGEQKPVTVPIADTYTNAVVDAVTPSMN
jgi:NitT/TauT family transport system substrate-binding protein